MIVAVDRAQQAIGITGNVAEIGVHHGRLFVLLVLLCRTGETGLAVDLFSDQERNVDGSGRGDEAILRANLARHAAGKDARVHAGDSTLLSGAAIRRLAGGAVRLFSVDGGHTEENTVSDLLAAQDSLLDAGIVVLDDCFNEAWPGVVSGVARYMALPQRQLVPFAAGGNKTLFCRPEYVAVYQNALLSLPARHSFGRMFGCPVTSLDFNRSGLYLRFRQSRMWRSLRNTPVGHRAKRAYDSISSILR
jgi:hypothetical protein